MNESNQAVPCACAACPGETCTCGCQPAAAPRSAATNRSCGCGANCSCGQGCTCTKK